jgi:ribosomal protein L37AE/L43A
MSFLLLKKEIKKVRIRTTYVWQCQDCGDYNHRSTSAEPRRCTTCGGKGVQTYKGTLAEIKKRKE